MNHEKAAALHELAGRPDGGFTTWLRSGAFIFTTIRCCLARRG